MIRFILIFVISFNCFTQTAVVLTKGDTAPFDGVLSDDKQMRVYRQANEENILLEEKVLKLQDLNATIQERSDIYKSEGNYYRSELRKSEVTSFWGKVGFFALGVLATGLAVKAADSVR
jgi:hypothetical protein